MDNLLKALFAGLFFGLWPLLMNRSGLSGTTSSAFFAGLVFLFVLPFAIKSGLPPNPISWTLVGAAGIAGGLGILCFNGMLASVTPTEVGSLFIVMILVQISVPALQMALISGLTLNKAIGLAFAVLAAVLLTR